MSIIWTQNPVWLMKILREMRAGDAEMGSGGAGERGREKSGDRDQRQSMASKTKTEMNKKWLRPITVSHSIQRRTQNLFFFFSFFPPYRLIQRRSDKGAYVSVAFPLIYPLSERSAVFNLWSSQGSAVIGNIFENPFVKHFWCHLIRPKYRRIKFMRSVPLLSFAPYSWKWMVPKFQYWYLLCVRVHRIHWFSYGGGRKWEKMFLFRFGGGGEYAPSRLKTMRIFYTLCTSLPTLLRTLILFFFFATRCTQVSVENMLHSLSM